MEQMTQKERRRTPRYSTQEGTFVNAAKSFGKIVDISLGGMRFHYLNWDEQTDTEGKLDIYFNGEDVVQDIPFQVLPGSHKEVPEPPNRVSLRLCRVQFTKLNKSQKKQLEHFIYHQTAGNA